MKEGEMGPVEKEVGNLVRRKALHKKKKLRMGSETWENLLDHLREEIDELDDAVNHRLPMTEKEREENVLEELGDIYGLLIHAAHKSGYRMYQVEQRELAKLLERFE
jgi:NTP pyrophosphatase (non-canonical NTP hydrolase)